MTANAAFLDRDGVINFEVNYLHEPDKAVLLPRVAEALKIIREHGFKIIVVTNQAGVAKGFYEQNDIQLVHQRLEELLAVQGAYIDDFFYCPHHPDYTGECSCRKPEIGMIVAGATKYNINIANSFMVGDRLSDIEVGRRAGCKRSFLVRTGYGAKVEAEHDVTGIEVVDDLFEAVKLFFNT